MKIDPAAVDPEDVEILADMVSAAVNEALRKAQELAESKWAARRRASTWAISAVWACRGCDSVSTTSYAPPVQRLVTELSKLPGVGQPHGAAPGLSHPARLGRGCGALAEAIREVKEKIGLCEVCFNLTDEARCRICQDPRREQELICVVEEPSDVIPMERTHEYHGVYHVLGGALSPIDGMDPEDLKIAELFARVAASARGARSGAGDEPDDDGRGDGAAHRGGAARACAADKVTRLASGLPVGSDLEYADEVDARQGVRGAPRRLKRGKVGDKRGYR